MKNRVALIGCGGIGDYHLGHFIALGDRIQLVGFCDLILSRAEDFSRRSSGCPAYTDYVKMLDETNPDMVFIAVPPAVRGEIEFELIRRKIHFHIQKPVALNRDLAIRVRDAAEAAGLITACGFQCRYSSFIEKGRRFCAENPIVFVDCTRIGGVPPQPWWRTKSTSGGQLLEQTTHQVDLVRWFVGEPDTVFSFNTHGFITGDECPGYDTDDASVTVVKFKNGALATIGTGCYETDRHSFDSKVVFSARDCRAELKILNSLTVFGKKETAEEGGEAFSAPDGSTGVVYREKTDAGLESDRTFIEAVITGDPSAIRSDYRDAVKTLEFTLACNEAMETGLPVKVIYG